MRVKLALAAPVILAMAFVILHLPFLDRLPLITLDEVWHAGTASTFSQTGKVINYNIGRGHETSFLYPILLGFWFKLFSSTLFSLRLFSLLGGATLILGLAACLTFLKQKTAQKMLIISAIVLSPWLWQIVRASGPVPWALAAAVWSTVFYLRSGSNKNKDKMLICSSFAALSALFHPLGLAFSACIGFILFIRAVRQKSFIGFFNFCTPLLCASVLVFIHLNLSMLLPLRVFVIEEIGSLHAITRGLSYVLPGFFALVYIFVMGFILSRLSGRPLVYFCLGLIALGSGYQINQWKEAINSPSYSVIARTLDEAVPNQSTVLSHTDLWFSFQKNRFYSPKTFWKFTPYSNLDQLLNARSVNFIVTGPQFENDENGLNIRALAESKGILIKHIQKSPFGSLFVYVIDQRL